MSQTLQGHAGRGKELFIKFCAECHTISDNDDRDTIGFSLLDIDRQEIGGTAADFDYSNTCAEIGTIWTMSKLDCFLQTHSYNKDFTSQKDRRDLIAYMYYMSKAKLGRFEL
ncbi:hypothetical protein L9F63_021463 [Diploptera punctata]|uniref:Cytochrome c domain-containing protein n=1 Tax=Diploptera punctata TaxID=6984 RepID=A0AAD7ZNU7_DIPPU|nr:hypothetical protein L9F63_021463 [Diploptera punctata]